MTTTSVLPRTPIPRPEDRGGERRFRQLTGVGLLVVVAYVFVITYVMARSTYDLWAGYVLAPGLFAVTAPFLLRMLRRVEPDVWVHKVVVAGLALKLFGGFSRYYANALFLGRGDGHSYYLAGSDLAAEFRDFIFFGPEWQFYLPKLTGTQFIRLLTALAYTVTGSTKLGGFVIFAFMSFWGLYLFYRAYRIAIPDGLHRRYAVLVFCLPSMVFWPSSIGKEAWMTTMLGLGAYGAARLVTQQRYGYTALLPAMAGMMMVRPHVAAIFGAGVAAAFILRRGGTGASGTSRKLIGIVVLAIAAGIVMNQLQAFFDFGDTGQSLSVESVLDETTRRSGQGGSSFDAARPTSISGYPWALVTVLFRPFLFEAGSAAGLITSLEGTILLALFLWNLPRLLRLPATMLARPYMGLAVVYTLIFCFAFSAISNFGILARQRTQLFPIAVIILTTPVTGVLRTRAGMVADRPGAPHGGSGAGPDDDEDDSGEGDLIEVSGIDTTQASTLFRETRWSVTEPRPHGWDGTFPYESVGAHHRRERSEPD